MIIVDANSWGPVFDSKNANHSKFAPVNNYILSKKRTVAWGGAKFIAELTKAHQFLRLFGELEKAGIAVRYPDADIDREQIRVSDSAKNTNFDDPHIIALQIISKAPVIVTGDKRSHQFIKMKALYPKHHTRPKIYSTCRHKRLLSVL